MNLLDLIFPKKCLECGKDGKYICDKCISNVGIGLSSKDNFAIFRYEGVIRKAIISLKYKFAYSIVDELMGCVLRVLKNKNYFSGEIVLIPIPLTTKRENWRGFNQTEILGKKLAKNLNWQFIPDLLIKTKETKHQVGLKGDERRNNLKNVFCVSPNYSLYATGYSLVLFDDVYTTGTTIFEAKKALLKAGFKNIKSLTIAR